MDRIKFTKIGIKPKGDTTTVVLHFVEPTEAGNQQHDIESKDAPLDSFLEAMRNLDNFVGALCGFPLTYAEGCRVHTVSIGSVGGKTAVILSVSKHLDDLGKAFNFNTPRFTESDEDSDTAAPAELLQAVNHLVEEANLYRNGERSQVALDLGDPDTTEKVDESEAPPAADSEEWDEGESTNDIPPPAAESDPNEMGPPDLPDDD